MSKLICYAISPAALSLLTKGCAQAIPPEWFNWVGAKPQGQPANARRLCLAATPAGQVWAESDIVAWDKACRSLGHDTVLVMSSDDETMADYTLYRPHSPEQSVHEEAGFMLLGTHGHDARDRAEVLRTLQCPDLGLREAVSIFRRAGGGDLGASNADISYAEVSAFQWWQLAQEFERWVQTVCQPEHAHLHPQAYPLNDWRRTSRGRQEWRAEDLVISPEVFFERAYSPLRDLVNYHGPETAWCKDTVPGFDAWALHGQALKAVYPVRSLPFCGVAELQTGELRPYGGFASLNEPWAWDANGEVQAVIRDWVARRDYTKI